MHGRVKVKTSAEQAEAKRVEREKKLRRYTAATSRIFAKRAEGELDEEIMELTGQILSANPDFYTLWNVRREVFLQWTADRAEGDLVRVFEAELSFLEACLRVNPKGYGIWQHRVWLMQQHPSPAWPRELALCNKCLDLDERNFHCWDYRRFVVSRSDVSTEKEFDFTTDKIGANFSNYSSWHYRSKLLPRLHADPARPGHVREAVLLQEFELAQNAFFTDPNDQSAWFYHRWLLGRGEQALALQSVTADRARCVVVLTNHIQENDTKELKMLINNQQTDCKWLNIGHGNYSKIWEAHIQDVGTDGEQAVTVQLQQQQQVQLTLADGQAFWRQACEPGARFRYALSAATASTLSAELNACQQLHELEPDNKWTLLTMVLLMRAVDALGYEQQMVERLQQLQQVDPTRRTYYDDLRSKFLIENAIERQPSSCRDLDLSNLSLTSLFHADHMSHVIHLNLSNNNLRSLKDIHYLQSVRSINIQNNPLNANQSELKCHLPNLQTLVD